MRNRLWRGLLALSILATAVLVQPAPVAAYRNLGYGFDHDLITVCIDTDDFTSSGRRGVIWTAALTWDGGNTGTPLLIYVEQRSDCQTGWGDIQVLKADTTNPLRTSITTSCGIFGCSITNATIKLDPSYGGPELYWGAYGTDQNCYVNSGGGGCDPDAYTLFTHEFGHALGLFENQATVTEECTSGWFSTNVAQACSTIGKKMMYGQAGIEKQSSNPDNSSGYRRENLTFDDKEGLRDIYGTN